MAFLSPFILSLWGGLKIQNSLRIGMLAGEVLDFCETSSIDAASEFCETSSTDLASESFGFCDNMSWDVVAGLLLCLLGEVVDFCKTRLIDAPPERASQIVRSWVGRSITQQMLQNTNALHTPMGSFRGAKQTLTPSKPPPHPPSPISIAHTQHTAWLRVAIHLLFPSGA